MHCQQMIKKESKKKSAPRRLLLLWLLLPFLAVFVVVVVAAFICIVLRLNSFRFGLFGSPLSPFSTLPHSSHLANACVCVCVPSMDALCHWLFPLFSTFLCLFATHTPFFRLTAAAAAATTTTTSCRKKSITVLAAAAAQENGNNFRFPKSCKMSPAPRIR